MHRVRLDRTDVVRHAGLLVTTRAETVLDCMGWLPLAAGRSLADRALQQGWMHESDLTRRLECQPGRWGNARLRCLARHLGDGAAADSERRLHRLLRRADITGWVPNLPYVADGVRMVIDVAFPDFKIAIEVDGYAYHRKQGRFQRDRTKQNALIGAGWRVLRFTWEDLDERPAYVVGKISALLAA
ncbi:MAG: endonuclease domain-containing protein [Mycobacteriales bacterium]